MLKFDSFINLIRESFDSGFNESRSQRKRRYDKLEKEIPSTGSYSGIQLKTGHLFAFNELHVKFLEDNKIDPDDVSSGGWFRDGVYNPSSSSDTVRWADMMKARKRVSKKLRKR